VADPPEKPVVVPPDDGTPDTARAGSALASDLSFVADAGAWLARGR